MKRSLVFILVGVCFAGCGGDDGGDNPPSPDGGGSGSSGATCTITATATADTSASTITGTGTATCNGAATIELETCVQWQTSTGAAFTDISCMSSTKSGVASATVDHVASCGITPGRMFRARVNATVDGVDLAEVVSTEIACE